MAIRSQLKDLEMVQMMIKNPPLEQTGGPKEEGQEKNPLLPVLQVKRQPRQQERLPVQDSKGSQEFCSQSAPVEETMQTTNVFEGHCTPGAKSSNSNTEMLAGQKARQFYAFASSRESARGRLLKDGIIACTKKALSSRGVFKIFKLGVEAIRKNLNITKPDTDELHKFSDGTLDDVRTALNGSSHRISIEYLPQIFTGATDKQTREAMIQAIDKRLKTRRIMRSLERFVGGRPYGGDLRLLQRTI
ncbi:hypothetical protein Tco_1327275 [Tanacetum coccineum]